MPFNKPKNGELILIQKRIYTIALLAVACMLINQIASGENVVMSMAVYTHINNMILLVIVLQNMNINTKTIVCGQHVFMKNIAMNKTNPSMMNKTIHCVAAVMEVSNTTQHKNSNC